MISVEQGLDIIEQARRERVSLDIQRREIDAAYDRGLDDGGEGALAGMVVFGVCGLVAGLAAGWFLF